MLTLPTHLPRLGAIAAIAAFAAFGLPSCGSDDSSSDSAAMQTETSGGEDAPSSAAAKPATVLACLEDAGLAAKDQSSSTGEKIGIDYPGGRTVISFEESESDAETLESISSSQSTGETFRSGLVVVSAADDPAAAADRDAIESCVTG